MKKENNQVRNSRSRKIGVGVGFALATIAVGSAIAVPNIIAYQNRPTDKTNSKWIPDVGYVAELGEYNSAQGNEVTMSAVAKNGAIDTIAFFLVTESKEYIKARVSNTKVVRDGQQLVEGKDYVNVDDEIWLTEKCYRNETVVVTGEVEAGQGSGGTDTIVGCAAPQTKADETGWKNKDEAFPAYCNDEGYYSLNPFTLEQGGTKAFEATTKSGHGIEKIAMYAENKGRQVIKVGVITTVKNGIKTILNETDYTVGEDNVITLKKPITENNITVRIDMGTDPSVVGENLVLRFWKDEEEGKPIKLSYYEEGHSLTNLTGYQPDSSEAKSYNAGDTATFQCLVDAEHPLQYFAIVDIAGKIVDIEATNIKFYRKTHEKDWQSENWYKRDNGFERAAGVMTAGDELKVEVKFKQGTSEKVVARAFDVAYDDNGIAWRNDWFNDKSRTSYYSEKLTSIKVGNSFKCNKQTHSAQSIDHIRIVYDEQKVLTLSMNDIEAITLKNGESDKDNWSEDESGCLIRNSALPSNETIEITFAQQISLGDKEFAIELYGQQDSGEHKLVYDNTASPAGFYSSTEQKYSFGKGKQQVFYCDTKAGETMDTLKITTLTGQAITAGKDYTIDVTLTLSGQAPITDPGKWDIDETTGLYKRTGDEQFGRYTFTINSTTETPDCNIEVCAYKEEADDEYEMILDQVTTHWYISDGAKTLAVGGSLTFYCKSTEDDPISAFQLMQQSGAVGVNEYVLDSVTFIPDSGNDAKDDTDNWVIDEAHKLYDHCVFDEPGTYKFKVTRNSTAETSIDVYGVAKYNDTVAHMCWTDNHTKINQSGYISGSFKVDNDSYDFSLTEPIEGHNINSFALYDPSGKIFNDYTSVSMFLDGSATEIKLTPVTYGESYKYFITPDRSTYGTGHDFQFKVDGITKPTTKLYARAFETKQVEINPNWENDKFKAYPNLTLNDEYKLTFTLSKEAEGHYLDTLEMYPFLAQEWVHAEISSVTINGEDDTDNWKCAGEAKKYIWTRDNTLEVPEGTYIICFKCVATEKGGSGGGAVEIRTISK